ncbi:POTRA domain-containing protein [Haliangium sp.]|uniref:BamA/OMP85 family outer membrane protein n=1 Tax=Haliangium sp. TaxID=2663208 RepID=UPI003D0F9581
MTGTAHSRPGPTARRAPCALVMCALGLAGAGVPHRAWAESGERGAPVRYEPLSESECRPAGASRRDQEAVPAAPAEPPVVWREWTVGGPLPEATRAKLSAILAPKMADRQSLTRDNRCELQLFVRDQLGYDLVGIVAEPLDGGGTRAVLEVATLTRIRHTRVEVVAQSPFVDLILFRWRSLLATLFEVDILRRMRLRPGSPLPSDARACAAQIEREGERIRAYLQREGYPEAQVDLLENDDADRDSDPCNDRVTTELLVRIRKGAPYRIGRIDIEGRPSLPSELITSQFRRGRYCVPELFVRLMSALGARSAAQSMGNRCFIERFSQEELNRALERVVDIYQKRGYPAVRVRTDLDFRYSDNFDAEDKSIDFTVIVNERRRVDVRFDGHSPERYPTDLLRSLLTFEDEGSYDDVEVAASADALRRYFQSRGHFEAQVTWSREDRHSYERIVFTIHPGPELRLAQVRFAGNRAVTDRELRDAVRAQPGVPFTAEDLARDQTRIAELYRQRGYRSAEVQVATYRARANLTSAALQGALVAGNAAVLGEARELYVRFDIREGPQTQVRSVDFQFIGAHRYGSKELVPLLAYAPGDPFVRERAEEGRVRIGRFYFENAYPRAQVQRCVRPVTASSPAPSPAAGAPPPAELALTQPGTDAVDVVYEITEREQVRFGKVLVHGNFKTRDWIISSELGYEEGLPLTLSRAEEGQQNLRASGLFNSVQVRFVDLESGTGPDVNVVVDVQERFDHWFGFEGAAVYSSDDGALLESALRFQNLFGQGLALDARAQIQPTKDIPLPFRGRSIEGSFQIPHWVTRRVTRPLLGLFTNQRINSAPRLETTAFWRRDDTPRFGDLQSLGTTTALSFVGRRGFWRGWVLSLRYDFRRRSLEENLIRPPGSSDDIERSPVGIRTGSIGPQLIIDKRRDASGRVNPLTPEGGFKLEFRALYASRYLGGQQSFVKLGASGQHFLSLGSRLVLSNGIRYDHGIPLPLSDSLLPETERFFAGGDTTVRGYEEDRLATEIIEEPVPPLGDITRIRVLPAGGNIRFVHNLDLQLRVWELFGVPVASAIFLDSGLVTNSLDGVKPTDLRHALGVALLRLVAPFGSISLEYAVPLDPQLGDNPRGRFHGNFGLLF